MSGVVWQDPPPASGGPGSEKWARIFAELHKRPGEWALVAEGKKAGGGLAAIARRKGIETTSRKRVDGTYDIYMRAH